MDLSPIILAHEEPFAIGQVEVRPPTRELAANGQAAVLEPRVMQLLVALHRADGRVVSKDDLVELCWGGRIVGEDAINRVVSRLRHDLARTAGDTVRIETITKVGYRLASRVDGNGPTIAASVGASASRPIGRRSLVIAGGGLVGAAAIGALAWRELDADRLPPEAEELIQQGRAALNANTLDQLSNAAAQFRQATEIAPESAQAWGLLAIAYRAQSLTAPAEETVQLGQRASYASRRALSLDPDNGDAVAADIWGVRVFGNWLDFERHCRVAVRRFPRHEGINGAMANLLSQVGRNREAFRYDELVIRANPDAPVNHLRRAQCMEDVGRLDEASSAFETAYRRWPRHYAIWFTRLYFLAYNGRPSEALAMIDGPSRPVGIPDWNFAMTRVQLVAMMSRRPADIAAALEAQVEAAKRGVGFAENAVKYATHVGALDTAFQITDAYYFDRGFRMSDHRFSAEQGSYNALRRRHTYFLFRSGMAPMWGDPRFGRLLQEVGLEDYYRRSGTKPDYRA